MDLNIEIISSDQGMDLISKELSSALSRGSIFMVNILVCNLSLLHKECCNSLYRFS